MPPELPDNQQRNPRHPVVEVITRAQEDALRQLREAGIPETQALLVMQRIAPFSLHTLRELDVIYVAFEELVGKAGRSAAHQAWLNDKAAALLTAVEAGNAGLVADAIRQARDDYQKHLSQPKDVITVPAPPRREAQHPRNPWLLWLVGLGAWFLFWPLVSVSLSWTVIAFGITAIVALVLFEQAGLVFLGVLGGLVVLLWLLT
jgi:hypothetical protein